MSTTTDLKSSAKDAILGKVHASKLTKDAMLRTFAVFTESMREAGFQISNVDQIRPKHIQAFAAHCIALGNKPGTLKNKMSHVRKVLRAIGKGSMLNDKALTNAALGIPKRDRRGLKVALSDERMNELMLEAIARRRPGMAFIVLLTLFLGLRGNEAIFAGVVQLQEWIRELSEGNKVRVWRGTKGNRPRITRVLNRDTALLIVTAALQVAKAQGGFLVTRANGRPAGSLKSAVAIYRSYMHRRGVQMHAGRYRYACELLHMLVVKEGLSKRLALTVVAESLGHGQARSRWVSSVYCRRYDELAEAGALGRLPSAQFRITAASLGVPLPVVDAAWRANGGACIPAVSAILDS